MSTTVGRFGYRLLAAYRDQRAIAEDLRRARRAARLARLAEKWGARLVQGGRVIREGGAR